MQNKFRGIPLIFLVFAVLISACSRTDKSYFPSGKIMEERSYKGKKLNGPYRSWYENGTMKQEAEYRNDKLNGKMRRWSVNGVLEAEEYYKDGLRQGKCTSWDELGNLLEEKTYLNDTLNGEYHYFYNTGVPKIEGTYSMGLYHGKWNYYSETGLLVGSGDFREGTGLLLGLDPMGRKTHEIHYFKNMKDGEEVSYGADGSILEKTIYSKDKVVSSVKY